MDADGGLQRQLTRTDDIYEGEPTWSPDGNKIAYDVRKIRGEENVLNGGVADEDLGIWVMNASGSHPRHVVRGGFGASWSPDGSKIAFTRNNRVYVVRATGGRPKNLTPGFYARDPAWSPDGHRIAFSGMNDLYVMKADGSHQHQLTATVSWAEIEPDWSPDGKWIVFIRAGANFRVALIRPNGKRLHLITARRSRGVSSPTWQPR